MTQKDKKNIDNKRFIDYFEYKIESNIKFIKYLVNCNEIYANLIEIRRRDMNKNEEIEVLNE